MPKLSGAARRCLQGRGKIRFAESDREPQEKKGNRNRRQQGMHR